MILLHFAKPWYILEWLSYGVSEGRLIQGAFMRQEAFIWERASIRSLTVLWKETLSLDLLIYAFIASGFQVFVPFFPRTSLCPRDCMTRISVVHLHFIWKVLQWNEKFVRSQEAPNEVYNSSMCINNFSRGVVICLLFKYLIWYRYRNIAGGCYECDISEWYVSAFCHTHTVDKLDRAFD